MRVQQLLNHASAELTEAGVEDSRLEAELLLRGCLGVSRSRLFLIADQSIAPDQQQQFQEMLSRRCQREPLQYILGSCEFWSLDFFVTPAVLIPRPETEFLLEHVFFILTSEKKKPKKVLDLCAGSGIISVVLAKELEQVAVVAVDCFQDTLAVAQKNSRQHGVEDRVYPVCADLLSCFRPKPIFDLIVTNPPYVKAGDLPELEPEVRDWEPEAALSGGATGMDIIERICRDAPCLLKPEGWLFMEIGADIGEQVEQTFTTSGKYEQVKVLPDWAGKPRVLQAKRI